VVGRPRSHGAGSVRRRSPSCLLRLPRYRRRTRIVVSSRSRPSPGLRCRTFTGVDLSPSLGLRRVLVSSAPDATVRDQHARGTADEDGECGKDKTSAPADGTRAAPLRSRHIGLETSLERFLGRPVCSRVGRGPRTIP
jgi:hypothetical protein